MRAEEPLDRVPEVVLDDVLDGFTSMERAGLDYGVVIDLDTMVVDNTATTKLRKKMRTSRLEAGKRVDSGLNRHEVTHAS